MTRHVSQVTMTGRILEVEFTDTDTINLVCGMDSGAQVTLTDIAPAMVSARSAVEITCRIETPTREDT